VATSILIKHTESSLVKKGYYGFSWTYLFFGWFVPLFRGELSVAALHLLFMVVTCGLWQIIFAFLYNKQYMTRKLTHGWVLAGTDAENQRAKSALQIG
jgi:hypothetical protein